MQSPLLSASRLRSYRFQWSLQAKLIAIVIGSVALILVASAIGTGAILNSILSSNLDARLREQTEQLLVPRSLDALRATNAKELLEINHTQQSFLLILTVPGGEPSGAISEATGAPQSLTEMQVSDVLQLMVDTETITVNLNEAREYRMMPVAVEGVIVGFAGVPLDELTETIHAIVNTVTTVSTVGVVLLAFAIAWTLRQGLFPLRKVAETATQVASMPLTERSIRVKERVPGNIAAQQNEIGHVAFALNVLLDHVDTSLLERQRNEERTRRFVSDSSHELRTPLASIRGYSELALKDTSLSPMAKTSIERVHSQSLRMTQLVDDLLLLIRLGDNTELKRVPVDVVETISETVNEQRALDENHHWKTTLPPSECIIIADPNRLRQVLTNLLSNSRVHTPKGTLITTQLSIGDSFVTIKVHDNGPGIDNEIIDEVFERFTRSDPSRARATGGTGLGLSISRAIITAHGGDLEVESAPGNTTFTISLPRKSDQD